MKAMVLKEKGTPFVLEDRPIPEPGPGEATVRVLACGAGLTIHHTRMGRTDAKYPIVIGHEITGEVTALGAGVTRLAIGDAVACYFYLSCGDCRWCRNQLEPLCENFKGYIGRAIDGGYAEYMKAPAWNLIKLPPGLDYKSHPAEVGVICDAIATPYKVTKRAQIVPQDTVAVVGAGGGVGIHMVMLASWKGARVIAVDIAAEKLARCKEVGADAVVDASRGKVTEDLLELTGGKGVDVVVDFVSSAQTLGDGVKALGRRGRLVTLGGNPQLFEVSARDMLSKELTLMGSRYLTRQELHESLELVARGEFWPLVTETYKLEEAEKAHERLEAGAVLGRQALIMDGA